MPVLVTVVEPARLAETVPAATARLELESAPFERTPSVRVTALVTVKPPRSSVPPVTVAAAVPRAEAWPRASVPAVTVAPPVKVLAPPSVSRPAPDLVREPVPATTPVTARESAATETARLEARVAPTETVCVPAVAVSEAEPASAAKVSAPPVPAASV